LEKWLEENPFDESEYTFPTADMLKELLEKRLDHPSCNAGAVFDNMYSDKLWKSTEDMMNMILSATKNQRL
jgi:hypothetical protein